MTRLRHLDPEHRERLASALRGAALAVERQRGDMLDAWLACVSDELELISERKPRRPKLRAVPQPPASPDAAPAASHPTPAPRPATIHAAPPAEDGARGARLE